MKRYAAIDIGSNAIRLLITDVKENNFKTGFVKTCFVRIPLRLGADAFSKGYIGAEKVTELEKSLAAFHNLIDVYKVQEYRAYATAAMREASNGREIIEQIAQKTGINVEIIDGSLEATLIHNIHVAEELDAKNSYMYIDVGGGSTEITIFSNNKIIASNSFPIGTVRFLLNAIGKDTWEELRLWLVKHLSHRNDILGIGTGGNINKLFKMNNNKKDNKIMTVAELRNLQHHLRSYTLEDRIAILGLRDDRADVIVPAAEIFLTIMNWASIEQMIVPKLGLADGVIHMLYEKGMVADTILSVD